ncbi:MAG: glycosyltransferase family 4 protein [Candidatus Peregrinibacteria bacterium]
MKIILATGIYPPDIGGPATYVRALAEELHRLGNEVTVITYGKIDTTEITVDTDGAWKVISVPWKGKPIIRWFLFAQALRKYDADADIVEAFSSVSVGVPMMLSRLKHPKKILRLGGDFGWERYADRGGNLGLKDWYDTKPWSRMLMQRILRGFDHIIFSTSFQGEISENAYHLPSHSVIENALYHSLHSDTGQSFPSGNPILHTAHRPLRLLFLGRFVGFKNLPSLVAAMPHLPGSTLTFVGEGPMAPKLRAQVEDLHLEERVRFLPPASGEKKQKIFEDHDILVIPSITEISPNVALEARSEGLPVLLSEETGLSESLRHGMVIRPLRSGKQIADAIRDIENDYENIAREAASPPPARTWGNVAEEHVKLFERISSVSTAGQKAQGNTGFDSPIAGRRPALVNGERLLMISGDRSILQGKQSAFYYTLQEFSKHWERIDVICPIQQLTDNNSHFTSPFENVFFHSSPHGLWYQPFWIKRKGTELISAYHHDVMTVHEFPPFYNGLGARWLHKITGIPYALEIHHIAGYPQAATLTEWIGRILSQFILPWDARNSAGVRAVNQTTKEQLKQWGIPDEKIHIVPSFYLDRVLLQNPIRTVAIDEGKSQFANNEIANQAYDLSFCGRLVPNKNLPVLLKAIASIPNIKLLIIGDGPERPRCEKLANDLGISNRVTFAGWLPSAENVIDALRSSRIFVMNSLSEGGPRVLLEAMAIGLPVIATPVGIVPEVIQEGVNGMLTDGSAEDLRYAISVLIGDEAMQKQIGNEARKVLDRFERGTLVKGYAEFLKGLI